MADAVTVKPTADVTKLPAFGIYVCTQSDHGDCPPDDYLAFALPAGTPFTPTTISPHLASAGGDVQGTFYFSPVSGQINNKCNGQYLSTPGFCDSPVTVSGTGSAYDIYLTRHGGFDSDNRGAGARPFFTVYSSSKGVVVNPSLATTLVWSNNGGPSGSTTTVQTVDLTPAADLSATPLAVIAGTVTAVNMINQRQFQALGGSFSGFLQYLPIVWVYDSSGAFKAAGLVVPSPPAEKPFENQLQSSVANGNWASFQALVGPAPTGWGALGYEIRGLTAGQTYSLVVTSPNYPPFKTSITAGVAQSTASLDINLDSNPGGTLTGVVRDTNTLAGLSGAQVQVSAPGYQTTTLTTDGSGDWTLPGLGAGTYQLLAVAGGHAPAAAAINVSASGLTPAATFYLFPADATITGTVYTNNPICPPNTTCAAFGRTVLPGAQVIAYDDTLNVNSPGASLALYRSIANSSGIYTLDGLRSGDSYKIFAIDDGYFIINQTTPAVSGVTAGVNFSLHPKPLDVDVYARVNGTNSEFQITNYTAFKSGRAWVNLSPFAITGSTEVTSLFMQRPDANGVMGLFLDYPQANLVAGSAYILHIEAQPNDPSAPLVVKEVPFGSAVPDGTCQAIDQALVGDTSLTAQGLPANGAPLDISGGGSGNASGLQLPAGGVIPLLSTVTPSMCMSATDPSSLGSLAAVAGIGVRAVLPGSAYASSVYKITMSSINYTAKGVNLTLAYNQTGASLSDLAIFSYNKATGKWDSVQGTQTIDPVRGTISINGLAGLAGLSVKSGGQKATGLMALSDGKSYRPNSAVLIKDDVGIFAVLRPSQIGTGGTYAGTTVRVYNFPNPFNLAGKTVPLVASANCGTPNQANVNTDGTVIKYEIPSGMSGQGAIRIFTTSGRLVRELDAGPVTGGSCYYTTWDGKNRNGTAVANGVYYGIMTISGNKAGGGNDGVFKMAVIK
jgi:hypothetical protein